MNVSEIREKLVLSGQYSEEEANAIKGKANLLEALDSVQTEDDLFNNLISIDESEVEDEDEEVEGSPINEREYIFSLLRDDELIDGNPTCAGLRRITPIVFGNILSSGIKDFSAPQTDERAGRATVVYEIVVEDMRGLRDTDINNPPVVVISDIADCWWGNTGDSRFAVHPSATASTRAEGRCFRKLLNLNTITAEENSNVNEDEVIYETEGKDEYIQSHVKTLIKSRCESLDIDVLKLVKSVFEDKYVALEQLSREDGGKLVTLVNEYQQGKEIPDDIKN